MRNLLIVAAVLWLTATAVLATHGGYTVDHLSGVDNGDGTLTITGLQGADGRQWKLDSPLSATEVTSDEPSPEPTEDPSPSPTDEPSPEPTEEPSEPSGCDTTLTGQVDTVGFTVHSGETVCFDPAQDTTVTASGNVVVEGTLVMRPNPDVTHTLRFVDVDESQFVGGGLEPVDSDVGLWIYKTGIWDAQGTAKTGWTRTVGAVSAGTSTFDVGDATGWQPGDRLAVSPTVPPGHADHLTFDETAVVTVDGSTVTVDPALSFDHPAVEVAPGVVHTAEVGNLTRNVKVEGQPAVKAACDRWEGRAHIWVHTDGPQTIRHVELSHLGPRQTIDSYEHLCRGSSTGVPGRNGLHFHVMGEAARGSLIEGVSAHHIGNVAFAPHGSTGMTLRGNVAYDVQGNGAYHWSGGCPPGTSCDETHELTYDGNLAAKVHTDPLATREHTQLHGFELGAGGPPSDPSRPQSVAVDNVSVAVSGGSRSSGHIWPENGEGIWTFEDNVTHNSRHGLFVWHVTSNEHLIDRFTSYHNYGHGVFHGAYGNIYRYDELTSYGNRASQAFWWASANCDNSKAWCPDEPVLLENSRLDAAGLSDYALILSGATSVDSDEIGVFRNNLFTGYRSRAVHFTFDFHNNVKFPTFYRLTGNVYGPDGDGDDLRCDDSIHADAVLYADDHGVELRRSDQQGTLHEGWNCAVTDQ